MDTYEPTRVLVVDDEPFISRLLQRNLTMAGYACLTASNADEAWATLQTHDCALVISDITMPGRSGLDLLRQIRKEMPQVAVIMLTGVDDRATAISALESGAYGYLIKPFDENEIQIGVVNALRRRELEMMRDNYENSLEEEVRQRTSQIRQREEEIVLRLAQAAEYRDDETGEHIRRVGQFASELARLLGWSETETDNIGLAAPMHDIGKMGIPDAILRKPGKLTPEEFGIIKTHPEIGGRILERSKIPLLKMAFDIALGHHEKWDGSGYPRGLRGTEIPESARIVAVCDVYDALVHDRIYRRAYPKDEALAIMSESNGKHFDPNVFAKIGHIAKLGLRELGEETRGTD